MIHIHITHRISSLRFFYSRVMVIPPGFFLYMMHPTENYMYVIIVNKKSRINVFDLYTLYIIFTYSPRRYFYLFFLQIF